MSSGASDVNYEAMLTTHLTTRRVHEGSSRSDSPPRKLSRREELQDSLARHRSWRGLADDAPANPQPPWAMASARPRRDRKAKAVAIDALAAPSCVGAEAAPRGAESSGEADEFDGGTDGGTEGAGDALDDEASGGDGGSNWIGLSDLAKAGKAVSGSKHEFALIAAAVAAKAAKLREQCAASGRAAAAQPTPLAPGQPVGFTVRAATRRRPERRPHRLMGEEDEDEAAAEPTRIEPSREQATQAQATQAQAAPTGAAEERIERRSRRTRWATVSADPPEVLVATQIGSGAATAAAAAATTGQPTTLASTQPSSLPTSSTPAAAASAEAQSASTLTADQRREAELRALLLARRREKLSRAKDA